MIITIRAAGDSDCCSKGCEGDKGRMIVTVAIKTTIVTARVARRIVSVTVRATKGTMMDTMRRDTVRRDMVRDDMV